MKRNRITRLGRPQEDFDAVNRWCVANTHSSILTRDISTSDQKVIRFSRVGRRGQQGLSELLVLITLFIWFNIDIQCVPTHTKLPITSALPNHKVHFANIGTNFSETAFYGPDKLISVM